MPSCGTCRYWAPIKHPSTGENTKVGHCVWRPPVLHLVPMEVDGKQDLVQRSFFPMIDADRWCGQWERTGATISARLITPAELQQDLESARRDFEAQD